MRDEANDLAKSKKPSETIVEPLLRDANSESLGSKADVRPHPSPKPERDIAARKYFTKVLAQICIEHFYKNEKEKE